MQIGEMFPAEMLAPATSLCVGANWVFNFIVGISFQGLEVGWGWSLDDEPAC